MAQKVQIQLVDDLDGSEATETITFGLDGAQYEIDLSDKNANDLRTLLQRYTGSARRVGGKRKPSIKARVSEKREPERPQLKLVREWARDNGHEVSDRGRIPQRVMEAYASTR